MQRRLESGYPPPGHTHPRLWAYQPHHSPKRDLGPIRTKSTYHHYYSREKTVWWTAWLLILTMLCLCRGEREELKWILWVRRGLWGGGGGEGSSIISKSKVFSFSLAGVGVATSEYSQIWKILIDDQLLCSMRRFRNWDDSLLPLKWRNITFEMTHFHPESNPSSIKNLQIWDYLLLPPKKDWHIYSPSPNGLTKFSMRGALRMWLDTETAAFYSSSWEITLSSFKIHFFSIC